jgi:hypothetical protein
MGGTNRTILGICGSAGSGKDTAADYLVKEGVVKVGLADPIKRFTLHVFAPAFSNKNVAIRTLWGESHYRNAPIFSSLEEQREFVNKATKWLRGSDGDVEFVSEMIPGPWIEPHQEALYALYDWLNDLQEGKYGLLSSRIVLQTLGTEWGRTVDQDVWVRYAMSVALCLKRGGYCYSGVDGLTKRPGVAAMFYTFRSRNVVIPDVRFLNEIEAIRSMGGKVIRLRRSSIENRPAVGVAGHASEAELTSISDDAFDLVLDVPEGIPAFHKKLADYLKESDAVKRLNKVGATDVRV